MNDAHLIPGLSERSAEWLMWALDASPDHCFDWPWADNGKGYGHVWAAGEVRKVSHLVLEASGRPRPDRAHALHSCDRPPCGTPHHLRWGTQAENVTDMAQRDRHGSMKVTREQIHEMRSRYAAGGVTQYELASEYGLTQGMVSRWMAKAVRN